MDMDKRLELKQGLLSNKPIVNDSFSDSDSSSDSSKKPAISKPSSEKPKDKSTCKHHSDRRHRRSRSREHHKHKCHGSHDHKHRGDRSDSRSRRHHKHRDTSKSDKKRRHRKSPKRSRGSPNKRSRSPQKSPKHSRRSSNRSHSPEKRRNYKDDLKTQYCDDAMDPLTRATKLASSVDSKSGRSRVERARKAQDYQSKELIKKAEMITGITLPKFYNPCAINPLKFAETEQKRKLLWSKKIEPSAENKTVWNVTSVIASRGDDRAAAKFKKLMGIHDDADGNGDVTAPLNQRLCVTALTKKAEEQAELFRRLDADYQSARNQTHTSRGVGLGYNQSAFIDPSAYLAGRRDV